MRCLHGRIEDLLATFDLACIGRKCLPRGHLTKTNIPSLGIKLAPNKAQLMPEEAVALPKIPGGGRRDQPGDETVNRFMPVYIRRWPFHRESYSAFCDPLLMPHIDRNIPGTCIVWTVLCTVSPARAFRPKARRNSSVSAYVSGLRGCKLSIMEYSSICHLENINMLKH